MCRDCLNMQVPVTAAEMDRQRHAARRKKLEEAKAKLDRLKWGEW